jgi:hypothetical protein
VPLEVDLDEVEFVTETKLTIRGSRRRTTVPKAIVDRLRLRNAGKVRWVLFKDGRILVSKVR